MRRWPSWLLRTLIPILLIASLVGLAVNPPILLIPAVAMGIVVAGCFMVLSDRRHQRTAATSIAYRGPDEGIADATFRYRVWTWLLGDPPQDPSSPEHQLTPKQQRNYGWVIVIALIFLVALEVAVLVLLVVVNSVNHWWGAPRQWGPLTGIGIMLVALVAELVPVALIISNNRRSEKLRRARREARARRRQLADEQPAGSDR